jgi:cyclopropane fatty-acyl-phospholipid synthase-like methyltransferase
MEEYKTEDYIVEGDHKPWEGHSTVILLKENEQYIHGNVLDIGCNTGGITHWLSKNKKVTSITGVDININVKEGFENNLRSIGTPYKFVCANLVETKMNDDFYDTAISFHCIEHIVEKHVDAFICNSTSGLKSGGYFIVSIPYMKEYTDPHHRAFYDEKQLKEIMERNNFETIKCNHVESDPRWRENHLINALFVKK